MKNSVSWLFCLFFIGDVQAIKFFSLLNNEEKELPDVITLVNDLTHSVRIEGRAVLLDGCFPLESIVLPSQQKHSLKGPDAWGLVSLEVKTPLKPYSVHFNGESIISGKTDSDTIEMVIKISEIHTATAKRAELVAEIIRTPK